MTDDATRDDRRAALEAAYDKAAAEAEPSPESEPDGPGVDQTAEPNDTGSVSDQVDNGTGAVSAESSEASEPAEKPESGLKFEPVEATEDATDQSERAKSADSDSLSIGASEKAPSGWRAKAREHWSKLPPDVQAEVHRRERETTVALDQSTQARRFQEQFQEAIRPFEAGIAASGVDPLTATRNLLQIEAGLRMGTPQQKAKLVVDIMRSYGVQDQDVDDVLTGNSMPPEQAQLLQAIDQKLAPLQQFMGNVQNLQQTHQQRSQQTDAQEVETFEQNHEFIEDVRDDMALLLEAAGNQGRELSLEDAYKKAIAMNPDVSTIVRQREAAARANGQNQSLAQKKRAAASITGETTTTQPAPPPDRRAQILEAWKLHEGGR